MESNKNQSSTSKKKGDKEEDVQTELQAYLEKNQDLFESEKLSEEKISLLKKENETKKNLIQTKTNLEIFDLIIEELKLYLQEQDKSQNLVNEKQKIQDEINTYYGRAKMAAQNMEVVEKCNKDIMENIKKINADKEQIKKMEEERYNDTKEKCDKFMEEYKQKYDEISNEAIEKENDELRLRIKECEENTAKIKENINEQMEMRKKQTEDIQNMLNGQIQGKLDEIGKESDKYTEENENLKKEIEIEKAKYGDNPDIMKGFNKKFEKAKKEYEVLLKDLIQFNQENQKLKAVDTVSIQKEIDKNKVVLENLIKQNKELQVKIKEAKEQKNKKENEKQNDLILCTPPP